jgi:uncharacterized protein YcsI (UPF0317 family)
MTTNFTGIDAGNVSGTRLALVTPANTLANAVRANTTTSNRPAGATFGTAVETSSPHAAGVRSIAARYDNFDDALLPMVLASGVTGQAAVAVAEAVRKNPVLLAQAERAFQRAQLSTVE